MTKEHLEMQNPFTIIRGDVQRLDEVLQKVLQIVESLDNPKQKAKKWLNTEEVAARLGVSKGSVGNLAKKGSLTKYKHGRITRFDSEQVDTAFKTYKKHEREDPYFGKRKSA